MKPLRLAAGAALSLLSLYAYGQQFYYQTKTPYQPQQSSASYEAAPPGYRPVYTGLLARHGSRNLTSFKADLAFYHLWLQAEKEHALTPLGKELGPDLMQMMKANFQLGYGNETEQGLEEHTELALRMHARLLPLFQDAAEQGRKIIVVTSGKDRAVDSGEFFRRSLAADQPALRIETGVDRDTLYFHKLNAKQDKDVPEASLAYQRWAKSKELKAIVASIHAQPQLKAAAQAALARLFTPDFIAALDAGRYDIGNTGSYTFNNITLSGDGNEKIANATDAALALYELYSAAADMQAELKADFTRYLPAEQARAFSEAEDAIAFYEKGPGLKENGDLNWRMAGPLLADFFQEADAIAAGDLSHAAKLRFAHAEIVIPFAAALGLPGAADQLPRDSSYSYANSAWRGAAIAPMAANIQWDLYRNVDGTTLVRMLYNERETDFSPLCASARWQANSHFYHYKLLKDCYNKIR